MNESIPLSEKLYLLGIHPEKGGIISASYTAMDYVLIGTLFMELYTNKNIRFEEKRIVLADKKSTNPLHRFLLEKMSVSTRPLKISRWMNKLHFSMKHVRKQVQHNLVDRRIIRMQPKQFLFFRWEKPMLVQKQVVYNLLSGIESQIFKGTTIEEELILLSFVNPAGLLRRIFPERLKRKQAQIRLKKMLDEKNASIAVADAITAAKAVSASVAASRAAAMAAAS